jgi:hypothetical protein
VVQKADFPTDKGPSGVSGSNLAKIKINSFIQVVETKYFFHYADDYGKVRHENTWMARQLLRTS